MVVPRSPLEVLPSEVAAAIAGHRRWFLIGGQAVRCYVPYRPSHDVDFGRHTVCFAVKGWQRKPMGPESDAWEQYVSGTPPPRDVDWFTGWRVDAREAGDRSPS